MNQQTAMPTQLYFFLDSSAAAETEVHHHIGGHQAVHVLALQTP